MKKKNFIWVSALCACLSMGFVSCDDEDDPISADVPSAVVTGLSFTDENEAEVRAACEELAEVLRNEFGARAEVFLADARSPRV